MVRGSGCSKSRLGKAAGAEVAVQQRHEKWHAAVARSTFSSQNAQNTTGWDQFLMFWSGKMVRCCGAKHICKSKCAKHHSAGPILVVPMSKNGTLLWREAHLQETPHARATFWTSDVEKSHAAVARSTFASQNLQNTCVLENFWSFRCGKGVVRQKR